MDLKKEEETEEPQTLDLPAEQGSFGAKQAIVKDETGLGFDYLNFVLNPECCAPVRMPAKFNYPSAFVSFKTNFTLNVSTAGDFIGYFAPQNALINSSALFWDYLFLSRTSVSPVYSTQSYRYMQATPASYNPIVGNTQFPYYTTFNCARVIGAVCEIKYIGTLNNESGTIIVSGNLLASNSQPIGYGSAVVNTPGVAGVSSPPTVTQQYNENIVKKYNTGDAVRMVWFPVDYSCSKFFAAPFATNTLSSSAPSGSASQLVFYINGYNLPPGSAYDVRIQIFYEAIPNITKTSLFAGSQALTQVDWKESWDKLNTVARGDLGRFLLTGVKKP